MRDQRQANVDNIAAYFSSVSIDRAPYFLPLFDLPEVRITWDMPIAAANSPSLQS